MYNGLNLTKIIGGISKTLNVANQVLPLYQQLKPIISNAKDITKIINILNGPDSKSKTNNNLEQKKVSNQNLPTFFQ